MIERELPPDMRLRALLLVLRRALIMALDATEDMLNVPRSLPARSQRRAALRQGAQDLTDRVE